MCLMAQTKEKQHFYIYSKTSKKKIHEQNKKRQRFTIKSDYEESHLLVFYAL